MERLKPALAQEGVEVEVIGQEGSVLKIRARRYGPGVPVAFLVKAIAGTFRRYHPEVKEVSLEEYDPGPEGLPAAPPSPEFDKVLKHKPHSVTRTMTGVPGIDLSGLPRAEAITALENAVRVWTNQDVGRFSIHGAQDDVAKRAIEKWLNHYKAHQSWHWAEGRPGVVIIHLDKVCQDPACTSADEELVMPGKIVLTGGPPDA